jgi:hypothetical protein
MAMTGKSSTNGQAKPSYEELAQAYAQQQAEIERLKQAQQSTLKLKIAEKSGALSLYGLGRFPLTIFAGQWLRVLDMADEIRAFIEANRDKLSWK